jgi:tight adherence protein B
MIGIALSVFTFLAVFLGIFAINLVLVDVFKSDQRQRLKEIESQLRLKVRERAQSALEEQQEFIDTVAAPPRYFSLVDLWRRFGEMTRQAGPNVDLQRVIVSSLIITALLCVPVYLFLRSYVLVAGILAVGLAFPFLYVSFKRRQRQNKLAQQLPDVLDLMSRVLRAGQTVPQSLNAVADEFRDPVGTEFGFCYEQQNLGLSLDLALKQMAERTGLMELKIMVLAMLVQRQTGGNLAELLDKLSRVMRQRVEMKGMIRAMTAEGRMQAALLLVMPFVTWFILYMLNKNYALKLFDHVTLIAATATLMVTGALWIRRIVNFDY